MLIVDTNIYAIFTEFVLCHLEVELFMYLPLIIHTDLLLWHHLLHVFFARV